MHRVYIWLPHTNTVKCTLYSVHSNDNTTRKEYLHCTMYNDCSTQGVKPNKWYHFINSSNTPHKPNDYL